jgi:hypothetical protein
MVKQNHGIVQEGDSLLHLAAFSGVLAVFSLHLFRRASRNNAR